MIVGLGTDIVENDRIEDLYSRFGKKFLFRIYTDEEIQYSLSHENPIPYLAARFAVKEAAVKSLNIKGAGGISWKDIEVAGKIFGKKKLVFHQKAKILAEKYGVDKMHVSLSHNKDISLAVVILESNQQA